MSGVRASIERVFAMPAANARGLMLVLLSLASVRVLWTAFAYFQNDRQGRHRVEAAWFLFVGLSLITILQARAVERRRSGESDSSPWLRLTVLAAAVSGSVILYWPAMRIGLLSDDYVLLNWSSAEVIDIHNWEHYRPLPLLAWKVLFQLGGATMLHAANILLHGVNAWLVSRLALRLGHSVYVTVASGLVFLTFPAAVEPVAWNSGVFDIAMVTLGLFYLHSCARKHPVAWTVTLLIAALFTKETAVAFPLIAAILRLRLHIRWRTLIVSVVITALYVALRVVGGLALPLGGVAISRYTVKEVIVRVFASLGVPYSGQELMLHPFILGGILATIVVLLLYVYCLRATIGWRVIIGPAIVLAGVLPLWQILFIGDDLQASRYIYLPLVGWSLMVADLVAHDGSRRLRLFACTAAAVLAVMGIWGVRQHLVPWQEAAELHDQVLQSAREKLSESRCSGIHFENVPDTKDGAYVFRNGLIQALQHDASGPGREPTCTFTWQSGGFVKIQ